MNKKVLLELTKRAEAIPKLEYDNNLLEFRDNIRATKRAVKRRLEALNELEGEVEYEITLNHLDDEEFV